MSNEELNIWCGYCNGTGQIACTCNCPHCDNEEDCDCCEGTGFDEDVVDLDAWTEAVAKFRSEVRPCFPLKDDEGRCIGLRSADVYTAGKISPTTRKLLVRDYLINKDEPSE